MKICFRRNSTHLMKASIFLAPLTEKDAKARAAKPEDFAGLSFIKELDQSGYIDSLYKKK